MDNIDQLVEVLSTGMVEMYRKQLARMEQQINLQERQLQELKDERNTLMRSYDRLEDWAQMQEARATALHSLVDRLVDQGDQMMREEVNEPADRDWETSRRS